MFNTVSSQWTWIGGSSSANQQGSYLTQGQPNALSFPGARSSHCIASDNIGNAWLFGGESSGEGRIKRSVPYLRIL